MLFVTNRRIEGSRRSQPGRGIAFARGDQEPGASLYFCQRLGPEQYVELTAVPFFSRLRRSRHRQLLFYVHGFSCQPEARRLPRRAAAAGAVRRARRPSSPRWSPIVWPCDDDFGLVLDYWDDQQSATASGLALARVLGKFIAWRDRLGTEETCLKHVNLLAHSMGNRVLATALAAWAHDYGAVPALFRNLFMVAADVANDLFAPGRAGARDQRRRPQRRRLPRRRRLRPALEQGRQPQEPHRPPPPRPHRPGRPRRRRPPTWSPSTATTSTAATTGSATPTSWPTRPAGPARSCATWSRPCAAAGSPASEPDRRRLILGDAFPAPPAPANSDRPAPPVPLNRRVPASAPRLAPGRNLRPFRRRCINGAIGHRSAAMRRLQSACGWAEQGEIREEDA